jgi:signal peptide peptidase SppA
MSSQPPVRIMHFIREHPWAMLPSALSVLTEVVELRARGVKLTKEAKKERIEAARRTPSMASAPAAVAVLNLFGPMAQRMDLFSEISGGTSTESFQATFQAAMADPNIGGIVLNIDSPGGSVYGVQELASVIAGSVASGSKPVVAVANSMAASAAYWVGSQAGEFVVTPGGEVGSIGVIAAHEDLSQAADVAGVKMSFITAPEGGFKAEGNPYEPLSADARENLQGVINEYYDGFVRAVASGRRASLTTVKESFGKGRMVTGKSAVALGMADRVATLQEVVGGMVAKQGKGARAGGDVVVIEASAPEDADLNLARARLALAARRSA